MSSELVTRNLGESPSEVVIVRRRSGAGRHEHHGGIWKIAYADFMTAMMAFFLVMWLLNATDRQTISAVASYFNPVKLTDRVSKPKGLHDPDSGALDETERDSKLEDAYLPIHSEDELFRDPDQVLARLASLAHSERSITRAEGSAGEAVRDPFDPEFRLLIARANAREAVPMQPDVSSPHRSDGAAEQFGSRPAADQAAKAANDNAVSGDAGPATAKESMENRVEEEIREALREIAPERMPSVEVISTSDGILISLTDEFDFGMFAIASAEPRPELVVIMEKIAQVLKGHPGSLVVRGHTDGRPFRTQSYDNWRLSSARAHMAYFMLVRGGVDERRFERIEGHADRSLKVAGEPEAAQNRRIEILLRKAHAS